MDIDVTLAGCELDIRRVGHFELTVCGVNGFTLQLRDRERYQEIGTYQFSLPEDVTALKVVLKSLYGRFKEVTKQADSFAKDVACCEYSSSVDWTVGSLERTFTRAELLTGKRCLWHWAPKFEHRTLSEHGFASVSFFAVSGNSKHILREVFFSFLIPKIDLNCDTPEFGRSKSCLSTNHGENNVSSTRQQHPEVDISSQLDDPPLCILDGQNALVREVVAQKEVGVPSGVEAQQEEVLFLHQRLCSILEGQAGSS